MSQAQIIAIQNEIAQKKVGENRELIPGKIAYDFSDGYYNVDADKTDQEGNSVPLVKIPPAPSQITTKYNVGDSVTVLRYQGKDCQTEILGLSNVTYPDETICDFYTMEPGATGTIYLACPDDGLIKIYSLDGAAGIDISPESNAIYNVISSGDYLYCSSNSAYVAFRIKTDGSGYQEIVSQSRYYDARGLAINPAGTHLYIAYSTWEPSLGIAKINISTGEIEETELTDVSFDGISDLCGYGIYLYLLGYSGEISKIAVYDFDLNFVREISVSDIFEKITADGTNIYLSNSSKVDIYSLSGTFVRSISESGIRAVAVKDGKIYTVAQEYGGGAT